MAVVVYAVTAFQQRNLLSTDKTPAPYFNLATLKNPSRADDHCTITRKANSGVFLCALVLNLSLQYAKFEKAHQQGKLNAIAIALDYQNIAEVKRFTDSPN